MSSPTDSAVQYSINELAKLKTKEDQLISEINASTGDTKRAKMTELARLGAQRAALYKAIYDLDEYSIIDLSGQDQINNLNNLNTTINTLIAENASKYEEKVDEKNNAVRAVELNIYYSEMYKAYAKLMFGVFVCLVLIYLLNLLYSIYIVPDILISTLIGLAIVAMMVWFYSNYADIRHRDKVYFDKYDFKAPGKDDLGIGGEGGNVSDTKFSYDEYVKSKLGNTCIGGECCPADYTYDASSNKCVSSVAVEAFTGMSSDTEYVMVDASSSFDLDSILVPTTSRKKYEYSINE